MSLYCSFEDLKNESDIEQKLIMPLLTGNHGGLAYNTCDILTKTRIVHKLIGKGSTEKLYVPDYLIMISGLPMIVIEAKKPNEQLDTAIREAQMYAQVINLQFPSGINPCQKAIVCNGRHLQLFNTDSDTCIVDVPFEEIAIGTVAFESFILEVNRSTIKKKVERLQENLRPVRYKKPIQFLGGISAQNEEIQPNSFGSMLSLDYQHIFSPTTREDRINIVRNAYILTNRRTRYLDEIDRIIHASTYAIKSGGQLVEQAGDSDAIIKALSHGVRLHHHLFLLIGAVGSGKTTFVDFLREEKLPDDIKKATRWISIDINLAPVGKEAIQKWLVNQMIESFEDSHKDENGNFVFSLDKIFAPELGKYRKMVLDGMVESSSSFQDKMIGERERLYNERIEYLKALNRFFCGNRNMLMILVLDNCDKRDLDDQLTVFQIVQWLKDSLKCLVFLPIRDVTYETHKDKPPLDTVIKDFVFKIEPPQFTAVLDQRIRLVIEEEKKKHTDGVLEYSLKNGIKIEVPRSDIGKYLGSIYKSLFDNEGLLRRMLVGLSGKNIRRAMEIFLGFCRSGHIDEAEIYKIRMREGVYALPYHVVARVLLRQNRRFFSDQNAFVKNLFQADPHDNRLPNNFARYAILQWLKDKFYLVGPNGIKGYHQIRQLVEDLMPLGFDGVNIEKELGFLIVANAVFTENQKEDFILDDLICISPAGHATLGLIDQIDYLAACAEDTYFDDSAIAQNIAERIGRYGIRQHYSRETAWANATDFLDYLLKLTSNWSFHPEDYLKDVACNAMKDIHVLSEKVKKKIEDEKRKYGWQDLGNLANGGRFEGKVTKPILQNDQLLGYLVQIKENSLVGFAHLQRINPALVHHIGVGLTVEVVVKTINRVKNRISLDILRIIKN